MIYTEMYGRLGNQFFRYAATRALQIKYYPHDELVFSFDQIDEAGKVDPSFYNVLEDFNVCNYNVYPKKGTKTMMARKFLLQQHVLQFIFRLN